MDKSLNLFEYTDYRAYLTDWLQQAKATKTSNLSRLAQVAEVHPTFLSHILAGTKHLSLEQATLISDHLNHTKLEQDYFIILINIDRAGNQRLKNYWQDKKSLIENEKNKLKTRFDKHRELTSEQRAEFYSSWLYVAIWVSTSIDNGQTVNQIADRFKITREKADEVLRFLLEAGLCTEKNGVFSLSEKHVHVSNESFFVTKHHLNWRMKSIQRMDARTPEELFFTAPMAIAKKDFTLVREKVNHLIKEIVDLAKSSKAEEVVALNIDLFHNC